MLLYSFLKKFLCCFSIYMVFYSVKRGRCGKRDSELRDRGGGDGGPGADGGRCGTQYIMRYDIA